MCIRDRFKSALAKLFRERDEDEVGVAEVVAAAEERRAAERADWRPFSRAEVDRLLETLENENVVMFRDGVVFRV